MGRLYLEKKNVKQITFLKNKSIQFKVKTAYLIYLKVRQLGRHFNSLSQQNTFYL